MWSKRPRRKRSRFSPLPNWLRASAEQQPRFTAWLLAETGWYGGLTLIALIAINPWLVPAALIVFPPWIAWRRRRARA